MCASPDAASGASSPHRSTSPGSELKPLLEGVDVLVHLASVVDPIARRGADGARQRRGHAARARRRGRGRRAQGRAGVERRRLRRVADQPGAAHRGRAAAARTPASRPRSRPPRSSACSASGATTHPGASRSRRCAPRRCSVPGAERLPSRLLLGRPDAAGAGRRRRPCRSCTSTTSSPRSRSWSARTIPGIVQRRGRRLARARRPRARCCPRSFVPALPADALERVLCAPRGRAGSATIPPGVVPYLVHPWVIANDRLRAPAGSPSTRTRRRSSTASTSLPAAASPTLRAVAVVGGAAAGARCRRRT